MTGGKNKRAAVAPKLFFKVEALVRIYDSYLFSFVRSSGHILH